MTPVTRREAAGLLAAALLFMVVACLAGCGTKTEVEPSSTSPVGATSPQGTIEGTVENVHQQANAAAREANLRQIDSAIQQYYNMYGKWPTSVSQLAPYFARGVPKDPAGGTYYIKMEGGQAKAAVR